jgi:rhomboid family GlyGly-CTERM serine protease
LSAPAPRAWAALALLLALAALAAWPVDPLRLDWQPGLATREPWRAFTAAAVHYSPLHLTANLAGVLLVGALGVVARVPGRIVLAWLAAWPLTQFGLLLRPELAHYGGLSGVLHAGVAAAALWLVAHDRGRRQWIGATILAALTLKIVAEAPWGPAVQAREGWDIAVAPFAHASGAICGLLCARLSLLFPAAASHDH